MRRAGIFLVGVFSVVLTHVAPALAQSTGKEPAGGAAIGEALGATAGALVATALVAYLIAGHRSGKLKVLARVASWAERHTGTVLEDGAAHALAGPAVLNLIVVANAQPSLGAKQPNRLLHQAGEESRAVWVELAFLAHCPCA